MASTNTWLERSHSSIKFVTTHYVDNPLKNVIEAKFMPLMQGVGCQELGWVCVTPGTPEGLIDAIKTEGLAHLGKLWDRSRASCQTCSINAIKCQFACSTGVGITVAKLT
jgi:hypothetical protein